MAERLQAWGIPTRQGFDPAHLDPDTDLVIVGNVCRKDNPEAQAALQRGLKVMSFPQALSEFFIAGKTSVVVAGTHGKTTTAALLSYVLVEAGLDPSFLVGGIPQNFGKSFHLGQGGVFVVEGDEYDTAFFDKRPKFVHYRPKIVVLTAVEFDHADIYRDMEAYRAAFADAPVAAAGRRPAGGLRRRSGGDRPGELGALPGRLLRAGPRRRLERRRHPARRGRDALLADPRGAPTSGR